MARLPDLQGDVQTAIPQASGGVASYEAPNWRQVGMAGDLISRAGQNIGQAAEIVAASSDRQDQNVVLDAINKQKSASLALQKDPNAGFENVRGNGVIGPGFVNKYMEQFDNSQSLISDSLQSASQRRLFADHAEVVRYSYQSSLLQHQAKETTAFNEQARNTTVALGLNDIAAHPYDDTTYDLNQLQMGKTVVDAGKEMGLTGDSLAHWVAAGTARLQSKGLFYRTAGMLLDNPMKASDFFHAHELDFDPQDRIQLAHQIKTTTDAQTTRIGGRQAFQTAIGVQPGDPTPKNLGGANISPLSPERMNEVVSLVKQPSPYDADIAAAAQAYNISPTELKLRLAVESSMNPAAVSPKGAVGIAQFMPDTAKAYGIDPTDPKQSIMAAAKYMAKAGGTLGGDMQGVDKAYVSGNKNSNNTDALQYAENFRALRQRLFGATQQPLTEAFLEGREGAVVENARALAQQNRPGDMFYQDQMASEARKYWAEQLSAIRGKSYAIYSGILGQSIGPSAIGSLSDLSASDQAQFSQLPPEKQHSLYNLWKSNSSGTDPVEDAANTRKYVALMGQSVADPIAFKARDIAADIAGLPKTYQHSVLTQFNNIDKEAAKGPLYTRVLNDSDVRHMIEQAGIRAPTEKTKGSDDYLPLVGQVKQWVDNFVQDNGKQPPQAEYQKAVANLLQKVKVPATVMGTVWPDTKPLFKVKPGEQIIVDGKTTTRPLYTNEAPARPQSLDEAKKLPSGTPFIRPDNGQLSTRN